MLRGRPSERCLLGTLNSWFLRYPLTLMPHSPTWLKCSRAAATSSLRRGVAHVLLSRSMLKLGESTAPSVPPSCLSNHVMLTLCSAAGTVASAYGLRLVEVLSSHAPFSWAMTI